MRGFGHFDVRILQQPGVIKPLIEVHKFPIGFETRKQKPDFLHSYRLFQVRQMFPVRAQPGFRRISP